MMEIINYYSVVFKSEFLCFEDGEKGDGKNDYECMEMVFLDYEVCIVENYEEDKEVKEICII